MFFICNYFILYFFEPWLLFPFFSLRHWNQRKSKCSKKLLESCENSFSYTIVIFLFNIFLIQQNALATCLDIFGVSLDKMVSSEINDIFRADLVTLFKTLLQRAEESGILENVLEQKAINIFCRLALRMTEKSLRHVYSQVCFKTFFFSVGTIFLLVTLFFSSYWEIQIRLKKSEKCS